MREVWRVADPPTSFISGWVWRLRRHTQPEKGDRGEAKPPQPPPLRKFCYYKLKAFQAFAERTGPITKRAAKLLTSL